MRKCVDLIGQRFGRLVVVSKCSMDELKGYAMWNCRCDCGNECKVRSQHLRRGSVKSCGCLLYKPKDGASAFCMYNDGVVCKEKDKCSTCGWNPDRKRQRMF